MKKKCIIIGASHAAAQLITSLRQEGWSDEILVIGDEPHLPYHRPPLSKAFLLGEKSADELLIRPAAFYEKNDVQFVQGRVTSINRNQRLLTLRDGSGLDEELVYDKLALCTGSRVREVKLPGAELKGIHYLRDLADAESIKSNIIAGQNAVVVGGGYIGLETAAALRKMGMEVTILEMSPRILQRVTAPDVSDFYLRLHRENGVRIHTSVSVTGFFGSGHVEGVVCVDGSEFPAQLVVIGVGVVPNVELAEGADLAVGNGVVIDEFCVTSDCNIVAAGDCTSQFNKSYDQFIRLESVPSATAQAKSAAASIIGHRKPCVNFPWFWSDQYGVKLKIAGLSEGYDELVVRGDRFSGESFTAFYLKEGRLIAADCVNRPQDFIFSKKVITENICICSDVLANESVSLQETL